MGEHPLDPYQPRFLGTRLWVVVIEATAGLRRPPYQFDTIRHLVIGLRDWNATGLYCADRYAVQLDVEASSCSDALREALQAHRQATDRLGMLPPLLLRAEVLTPDVLKSDWLAEQDKGGPRSRPQVQIRVYEATRTLLRANTADEIRVAVAAFVTESGGAVTIGPACAQAGEVMAHIGLHAEEEIYASAESFSVAGMLIESTLPALVEDARRAWLRLGRRQDHC